MAILTVYTKQTSFTIDVPEHYDVWCQGAYFSQAEQEKILFCYAKITDRPRLFVCFEADKISEEMKNMEECELLRKGLLIDEETLKRFKSKNIAIDSISNTIIAPKQVCIYALLDKITGEREARVRINV